MFDAQLRQRPAELRRVRAVDLAARLRRMEVVAAAIGVQRAEQAVARNRLAHAVKAACSSFLLAEEHRQVLTGRVFQRYHQVSRIGVKAPGMIAVMAPVGSGVKRGFERPQECGFLLDFATAVSPFSGIGLGLRKLSPSMTMR